MDDGHAIHYSAVERGTPVYGSDGVEVGTVDQVVDNYREHILDGIVIRAKGGEVLFADAPEVARTAERGVTLSITSAEAAQLPPPERGAAAFRANVRAGRLGRLLGGGWKRQ
jgi:sporulation protein YlmC with PRC-barrel domain